LFDEAHALERRCGELRTCEIALECMSGGWDKALMKCRREAYGRVPTVAAVCTAATAQIVADLLRNDEYITQVRRVADMATLGAAIRHTGPSPSKQVPAKSMLSSSGHASSWDEELSAVSTADVDDGDFSQRCASSCSEGHEFHGRIHTTHWDVEARSWPELSHGVLESRCSTPVEMPSCAWLSRLEGAAANSRCASVALGNTAGLNSYGQDTEAAKDRMPMGARSFQRAVIPTKICPVIPRSTASLAAIRA